MEENEQALDRGLFDPEFYKELQQNPLSMGWVWAPGPLPPEFAAPNHPAAMPTAPVTPAPHAAIPLHVAPGVKLTEQQILQLQQMLQPTQPVTPTTPHGHSPGHNPGHNPGYYPVYFQPVYGYHPYGLHPHCACFVYYPRW